MSFSCCFSQLVSRMFATVLEWLWDFLTGAIMESRNAARSKTVPTSPPPPGVGKEELSLLFLAPCSPVPLAHDFSRYPFNGDLARRLEMFLFSISERWFHRHHNGSVNSKRVPPPKGISQVLTSALALDIWARANKLSPIAYPINSNHSYKIYLQLLE